MFKTPYKIFEKFVKIDERWWLCSPFHYFFMFFISLCSQTTRYKSYDRYFCFEYL